MLNTQTNLKTLDKRISELELDGDIVISFDFDELLVPIHLTREVSKKASLKPRYNAVLKKLGASSFEGIKYLNGLMQGFDFNKYKEICDNMARETPWTAGFDDTLKYLMKKYSVNVISSGLKDVCESKLREIDFNPRNIIAGELLTKKNKILESSLIVSDVLKGYVVKELRLDGHKVIAVGHDTGDRYMLDRANLSISFNSGILNLAHYDVKTPEKILEIVDKLG